MKSLFALLAIALISIHLSISTGGFTQKDPSVLETDSNIKSIVEFGEKKFLEEAFAAGKISSPELTVKSVTDISTQVVSGLNVKFTVEYVDSEGKPVIAKLLVFSQPWTNTLQLTSYEIVSEDANTVGGFNEQDPSTFATDSNIKSIIEFGEKKFLEEAFSAGKISSSDLTVKSVTEVSTQVVSGLNVKFTVEYVDSEGKSVMAKLVVFSQPWTNTLQLTSYEIVTPTEDKNTVGSYKEQDPASLENDPTLKPIIEFGEKKFLEEAFSAGKIGSSDLTAKTVSNISKQVVAGLNVKFTVEFVDSEGKSVVANLVVFSQSWTNTLKLTSYDIVSNSFGRSDTSSSSSSSTSDSSDSRDLTPSEEEL